MTAPGMMGISSPTGSHLPELVKHTALLPADALVIEHGAGLYSTPLLARLSCSVLCVEPHPGWREWASWIYEGRAEMLDSFKRVVPHLDRAALVFIDGPAGERGPLIQACLDRRVPVVIAHDTNEKDWQHYGYRPHMFIAAGYAVSHIAEDTHRTTTWVRRA
jgi:hypothetical protein